MTGKSKKSFWALIATQFFGAFNDNLLKVLINLLVIAWVADMVKRKALVSLGLAVFVAPFILFSMIAGRVADRVGKPRVVVATKFWELLVIAASVFSLLAHNIPGMLVSLFMLSLQATFFSPAKYGVLPEMMGESDLPAANAYLNIFTFAPILLGTLLAGFLVDNVPMACVILAAASLAGLAFSFLMDPLPAAKPGQPLSLNPLRDLIDNWQLIKSDRSLKLSVIAVNFFWFMGAALQTNVFLYTDEMMGASAKVSGMLVVAVGVGVGAGSFLCSKLSRGKVELGLVPIGVLLMSLFSLDLMWSHHSFARTALDFFMVGVGGGFYDIPLMALIQWRSPAESRGRVLATVNFLSFIAIGFASGVLWLLSGPLHQNPAQVFFYLGLVALGATFVVVVFIPESLIRFVLYLLTSVFYRMRIIGAANVPAKGPALLVSNHLSLVDGFLVGGAIPRLIRFLIWRPYYEARAFHWLLRTMRAIPISETDPPKQILKSLLEARKALEAGELVCIFAEGQVSRTGNLLEFKKGFEVIVRGLDVPVIPVNLDRVWGSIFSFEHGKAVWKMPRQIPYPVTITFGEPVKPPVNPPQVRQAVLNLGAEAFRLRMESRRPLPIEFLRQAKKHPSLLAVADSSGKSLSFGDLAAAGWVLAGQLDKLLDGRCVGIMLPPSVGGALANIAVSLAGGIPVNLNYTAGPDVLAQCIQKAEITRILTSRKLLEKTALPATPAMIYLEDVMATLPRGRIVWERLLFSLLPARWMLKRFGGKVKASKEDIATILFSSGSTGIPKGVMLSHDNVLSNILGLAQVFDVGRHDRMLGILPFFHSFGFTVTIWFPLIHGFSAVYHTNPLDAKRIGELAAQHKATMLLATPTFLSAYTKRCTPEQFHYLRFVITGAERMREPIAQAFQEKFHKVPLEGYGCTELSPVATANVPDVSMGEITQVGYKPGKIGHPIPGVSVRVVNPDTFEPLPQGEAGLLLVKGPNVMMGYWKDPEKTKEVMRDGWYITGDIASIDNDGFVQITDRLSRFSKIAGEMVPHVLVEEKLHTLAGRTDPTFVVTAVPDEKKGEQLVVLYAGYEGSIEDLHAKLNQSDLPKLWIPAKDRFFPIPAIPYLGTGKLDLAGVKMLAKKTVTA